MIPAIINKCSGTAAQAREVLEAAQGFDVIDVEPSEVSITVKHALRTHPKRIVVAGGDGTICTAAAVMVGTQSELAILPGGTLNHFAQNHGIPSDLHDAVQIAGQGRGVPVDVAYATDRLFLNTSAVGAYISYVRIRDRLERYVGYWLASFAAALRLFFIMKPVSVQLDVEGVVRQYDTPLVFIGVGERELKAPAFGSRIPDGRRCLHVIVVRERRAARLVTLAIAAAARGVTRAVQTQELDSYLVDCCTIGKKSTSRKIALDGEIVTLSTPIEYRMVHDALTIVVPNHEG